MDICKFQLSKLDCTPLLPTLRTLSLCRQLDANSIVLSAFYVKQLATTKNKEQFKGIPLTSLRILSKQIKEILCSYHDYTMSLYMEPERDSGMSCLELIYLHKHWIPCFLPLQTISPSLSSHTIHKAQSSQRLNFV